MKYERYENGVLVESIPYTEEQIAALKRKETLAKILQLEEQITPRRNREAILGLDGGWLANQEALIQAERDKL